LGSILVLPAVEGGGTLDLGGGVASEVFVDVDGFAFLSLPFTVFDAVSTSFTTVALGAADGTVDDCGGFLVSALASVTTDVGATLVSVGFDTVSLVFCTPGALTAGFVSVFMVIGSALGKVVASFFKPGDSGVFDTGDLADSVVCTVVLGEVTFWPLLASCFSSINLDLFHSSNRFLVSSSTSAGKSDEGAPVADLVAFGGALVAAGGVDDVSFFCGVITVNGLRFLSSSSRSSGGALAFGLGAFAGSSSFLRGDTTVNGFIMREGESSDAIAPFFASCFVRFHSSYRALAFGSRVFGTDVDVTLPFAFWLSVVATRFKLVFGSRVFGTDVGGTLPFTFWGSVVATRFTIVSPADVFSSFFVSSSSASLFAGFQICNRSKNPPPLLDLVDS